VAGFGARFGSLQPVEDRRRICWSLCLELRVSGLRRMTLRRRWLGWESGMLLGALEVCLCVGRYRRRG
jgi:hypothetical protein